MAAAESKGLPRAIVTPYCPRMIAEASIWEKISAIAQSIGALATTAAVLVALWLARRQASPVLKVSNGFYQLARLGSLMSSGETLFRVGVVNSGLRDVVIQGVVIRYGLRRKVGFIITPMFRPESAQPGIRLEPAASCSFLYPESLTEKAGGIVRVLGSGWRRRINERLLKIGVYLSTGEEILVRMDPEYIRRIRGVAPTPEASSTPTKE